MKSQDYLAADQLQQVAPYAGAWIEIACERANDSSPLSLPTRERGLKCFELNPDAGNLQVAPYAGAWIEIEHKLKDWHKRAVAPYAGAWIEIRSLVASSACLGSLPPRERGLK